MRYENYTLKNNTIINYRNKLFYSQNEIGQEINYFNN